MEKIFKLNQNSSLVMQVLNKPVDPIVIEIPTNHILVIDCSGSMWKDLEKIRHQLKNKLSSLVKQNDTVSIVWFSGRNEFGVLKEQVPIKTLKDLSELHQAIDRYLTDIGLTGFKQPLELVSEMIDRIASKRPNTSFNMMFLTDGYDNQSNKSDILEICKTLSAKVHSSTLIEYGNYANTQLLNEMASILGGQVIYSESFIQYEPVFDSVLSKSLGSAKKKEIKLSNKPKFDIAVSISENSEITVFNVDENNTILVPENTVNLTYMIESKDFDYYLNDFIQFAVKDVIANRLILQNIYSMIYVLSQRNKSKEVYDILESLGDKQLSYKYDEKETYVLNLRTKLNGDIFPIINRDMIKKISAIDTFKKAYELLEYQAAQKVFSHFEKTLFPKESKGLKELYGDEATLWLNELGFTDFNGFSPKTIADKANEIYIAKELVIAIKGLSSLPSINAVQKKLDANKSLTPSELMINTYLHEYKSFLNSSVYIGASNQENLLETWLKDKKKFYVAKTRELIKDIAKTKFAIILGQTWFMEFPSIDDSSLSLKVNELCEPKTIEVRAELKEVEIKI